MKFKTFLEIFCLLGGLLVMALCYRQVTLYHAEFVNQNKMIDDVRSKCSALNEEDITILRMIDEQNRLIKAQDDKIRIQNALIDEIRAKVKRK